jgi:probable addiction module antidote protein
MLIEKKKKPVLRKFDVANYLDDPGMMAAYMEATIEEANGDQAIIMNALNTVARAQKQNMSKLAKATGITRSGLYEALSPKGNPSFITVVKLADALGLRVTFTTAR